MGSVLGGHHVLNEQFARGTPRIMGSVLRHHVLNGQCPRGGHHVLNGQCARGTPRNK